MRRAILLGILLVSVLAPAAARATCIQVHHIDLVYGDCTPVGELVEPGETVWGAELDGYSCAAPGGRGSGKQVWRAIGAPLAYKCGRWRGRFAAKGDQLVASSQTVPVGDGTVTGFVDAYELVGRAPPQSPPAVVRRGQRVIARHGQPEGGITPPVPLVVGRTTLALDEGAEAEVLAEPASAAPHGGRAVALHRGTATWTANGPGLLVTPRGRLRTTTMVTARVELRDGRLRVGVREGRLVLEGGPAIEAGQALDTDGRDRARPEPLPAAASWPQPPRELSLSRTEVPLAELVPGVALDGTVRLEVALDERFVPPTLVWDSKSGTPPRGLGPGLYWLRLSRLDPRGFEGPPAPLAVVAVLQYDAQRRLHLPSVVRCTLEGRSLYEQQNRDLTLKSGRHLACAYGRSQAAWDLETVK